MVQFCIHCHNILLLKEHEERMAFYCPTCPYVFKIVSQISKVTDFVPKKMEEPSIDMNEIASSKTMGKLRLYSGSTIICRRDLYLLLYYTNKLYLYIQSIIYQLIKKGI
ncbi:hypothetical protein [Cryptosporidium parvum Iowa II]|uniref:DNA-directed RNA polymerase II subunit RPB9-like zinc ribbon domain-containing protein n=1 Tax=Cryptosporidium parvum (strain Iowa II) TaxID=353152 RepID=Q5CYY9_CRYPI|nr:hypothetical protein [Cryptosporidium parvum Iowa II]EAK90597.1 hypothetical protein cgd7_505 [Cryptosporidium parvum Iowa II]